MYSQLVAALLQQKESDKDAASNISAENIFGGVQFLSPVIDIDNEVTDFKYAWLIMPEYAYSGRQASGNSLSGADIGVKQFDLIKKFRKVYNTGKPLIYNISAVGSNSVTTLKVQKLDSGLLLWQENITPQKGQKIDGEMNISSVSNTITTIIYILDIKDQRILYLNEAGKQQLGIAKSNKNLHFSDLTDPAENLQWEADINTFIAGSVTAIHESQLRLKVEKGTFSLFRLREKMLLSNENEKPTRLIGVGIQTVEPDKHASIKNPVSEKNDRKKNLKQLPVLQAESENERADFFEQVTEATPDIVFLMDLNTKEVLYTNRSVPLLMGYSLKQAKAIVHPIFDCMFPTDLPAMLKHLEDFKNVKDGEVREIEYRLVDVKGGIHWYLDRNTVFKRNEKGIVTEKIGIAQEITNKKLQEQEIATLNSALQIKNTELEAANIELNAFNNIAANYYKETLRNLYTSMEFIITNDAKALSNEGRANLRRSQSAIQKTKLFTEDIVAFSGIRNTEKAPVPCDLNLLLAAALKSLQPKIESVKMKITQGKLPVIPAYPDMLSLLFIHLVNNAVKFRNETVSVSWMEITCEKKMTVNLYGVSEAMYCISFKDNGIGFNDEYAADIFSLFMQLNKDSKYKGSGIGLAVCKKIMDLHKGTISASGKQGGGAEIICCFPV